MTQIGLATSQAGKIVILGAGNCNDVDLEALATQASEIHLVDLDPHAIGYARTRHSALGSRVILHGNFDLTRPEPHVSRTFENADAVVSTTVLTQLIDEAVRRGAGFEEIIRLRDEHISLIVGLLRPGGTGIIINDVVSSDTCPDLRNRRPEDLKDTLEALIRERNFFTGTNPFAMWQRITDGVFGELTPLQISDPWLWHVGARTYLVCAVSFQRTDS